MNKELKQDMEMLARLVFKMSKKYNIPISAYCVNKLEDFYAHSMVTYGEKLNDCLFWGNENLVEFKGEDADANIQSEKEA